MRHFGHLKSWGPKHSGYSEWLPEAHQKMGGQQSPFEPKQSLENAQRLLKSQQTASGQRRSDNNTDPFNDPRWPCNKNITIWDVVGSLVWVWKCQWYSSNFIHIRLKCSLQPTIHQGYSKPILTSRVLHSNCPGIQEPLGLADTVEHPW